MFTEKVVTVESGQDGYPPRLYDLTDPPSKLTILGEIPQGPAVAMVGARAADATGIKITQKMASDLASCGVTVISGGAKGIDQAAHQGALDAAGKTVMERMMLTDTKIPRPLKDETASSSSKRTGSLTDIVLASSASCSAAGPAQLQAKKPCKTAAAQKSQRARLLEICGGGT